MFPYLDNALSVNWLQNAASITSTTTPTGIDLVNAVGPVGLAVAAGLAEAVRWIFNR